MCHRRGGCAHVPADDGVVIEGTDQRVAVRCREDAIRRIEPARYSHIDAHRLLARILRDVDQAEEARIDRGVDLASDTERAGRPSDRNLTSAVLRGRQIGPRRLAANREPEAAVAVAEGSALPVDRTRHQDAPFETRSVDDRAGQRHQRDVVEAIERIRRVAVRLFPVGAAPAVRIAQEGIRAQGDLVPVANAVAVRIDAVHQRSERDLGFVREAVAVPVRSRVGRVERVERFSHLDPVVEPVAVAVDEQRVGPQLRLAQVAQPVAIRIEIGGGDRRRAGLLGGEEECELLQPRILLRAVVPVAPGV